MRRRYVFSPEAALDLAQIWRYIKQRSSVETADRVESAIRREIASLSRMPGAGHAREDLTNHSVKFFAVYSYLVVYRPDTKPLQVVAILHGNRDVEQILGDRL